jgi:hypothetical protein
VKELEFLSTLEIFVKKYYLTPIAVQQYSVDPKITKERTARHNSHSTEAIAGKSTLYD